MKKIKQNTKIIKDCLGALSAILDNVENLPKLEGIEMALHYTNGHTYVVGVEKGKDGKLKRSMELLEPEDFEDESQKMLLN